MSRIQTNHKFTVPLADGLAVEAVYYGSGTLCISSQAGCALACPFCASGSRGLLRNLSFEEMFQQLRAAFRRGYAPQRVTISGIGEPLHNLRPVLNFIDRCRRQNFPVSLTTTGHPLPNLRNLFSFPHNGLMLSLHAGCGETHRRLIPGGPDFAQLWSLLDEALSSCSKRRRRKVGINYLLLDGINDTDREVACLLGRLRAHPELTVHLLTCNPLPGSPYHSPPPGRIEQISSFLRAEGCNVRLSNRWRAQQSGGCGTLFVRGLSLENPGTVC